MIDFILYQCEKTADGRENNIVLVCCPSCTELNLRLGQNGSLHLIINFRFAKKKIPLFQPLDCIDVRFDISCLCLRRRQMVVRQKPRQQSVFRRIRSDFYTLLHMFKGK